MVNSNNKVLVFGAGGMLGQGLVKFLREKGADVIEAAWPECNANQLLVDITDEKLVRDTIAEVLPAVTYNCAGYTDVDGAETQEDLAMAVNSKGPEILAKACLEWKSVLVHVSTDYVFDGRLKNPREPDDKPSPINAYGRSKLSGEKAIKSVGGRWLIVRTSWLFGEGGKNFVDTILTRAKQRDGLKVVNDQMGCPTYVCDFARCLVELAGEDCEGIYHFCNPPVCSWFDLARKAIEIAGLDCKVEPCSTEQFPRPAERPQYSVLDCTETFKKLGWSARPWLEALRDYINSKKISSCCNKGGIEDA